MTISDVAERSQRARVTICDVAARLGVTKSTVSRALNGYPDISASTQLRVRNAAKELGYRPLAHAQAIKTGRIRSIGLVLQISEPDEHRPFLADFIAGVSKAASDEDWTMTVATAIDEKATLDLLVKLAEERKADGFILPRTYIDDSRIHALKAADIPFVLYGRTRDDTGCAWFDIEGEKAMEEAILTLAQLGHRRIGFIPGGAGYTYAQLRYEGFRAGLQRAGLEFDPALVAQPAVNRSGGAIASRQLLTQDNPPTAFLCAVDLSAIGVYDTAVQLDLKIGRDISVISYDGIPEGNLMDPPLSTFRVDTRSAGSELAQLLIRRIEGEPPEALRKLARASFQSRGSHGPMTLNSAFLAAHIQGKTYPMGG